MKDQGATAQNTRARRGPNTAAGRARSARNALRHGLSILTGARPESSPQVEELARQIAGAQASAEILNYSRAVAEAHIDWWRVRNARYAFLLRTFRYYYEPAEDRRIIEEFLRGLNEPLDRQKLAEIFEQPARDFALIPLQFLLDTWAISVLPEGPGKRALIMAKEFKTLDRFDRYERRASSRRARAVERFDAARALANHKHPQSHAAHA